MSAPTTLQTMVCNYLAERRRLGFELTSCGRLLMSFARYVEAQEHQGPLSVEIMARWAKQDKWQRGDPATWARRLKQLRPFTRYLRQFEPHTEVPDESIFGPIPKRLTPHIYSAQEIVDLLAAARTLSPTGGLRPATYETLFGLIAAAGLRLSEAVHLLEADVDLKGGLLTVRKTKFAKSRQLPLHPSTVEALRRYRNQRSQHVAVTAEMPFFVSSKGRGLGLRQVARVFAALRQRLGWVNRGSHDQPRIHDLRHHADNRIMPSHRQPLFLSVLLSPSYGGSRVFRRGIIRSSLRTGNLVRKEKIHAEKVLQTERFPRVLTKQSASGTSRFVCDLTGRGCLRGVDGAIEASLGRRIGLVAA